MNTDSACCGVGRLGAEEGRCNRNSTLCADPDTYMFFDAVHSTQRAAELMAQQMFEGLSQITEPISFKQLAQKRS
jgi:phospholipase/lecithinase/hemolysin